jgi:hypothetical protein
VLLGESLKALIFTLLLSVSALAQDAVTHSQDWCAKKAEANMQATGDHSPEIAKRYCHIFTSTAPITIPALP